MISLFSALIFLNPADIGSITILWSQSVGGLQMLAPDGRWKWVQHIENALVCE